MLGGAQPHAAATYFAQQLAALIKDNHHQRYRYYHGERAPRVDGMYCVAKVFGVLPRYFLPDTTE